MLSMGKSQSVFFNLHCTTAIVWPGCHPQERERIKCNKRIVKQVQHLLSRVANTTGCFVAGEPLHYRIPKGLF
jgi:hypothetical protein